TVQEGLDYEFMLETFIVALSGVPVAMLVTIVALLIALPLGFLLALTRVNRIPVINQLAQIYVSFVRGTPIIIQIFVIYSSIPIILNMIFTKYNIGLEVYDIHPIWYAFVVFSFSTTAIIIEVFRSAINTMDKGQLE